MSLFNVETYNSNFIKSDGFGVSKEMPNKSFNSFVACAVPPIFQGISLSSKILFRGSPIIMPF